MNKTVEDVREEFAYKIFLKIHEGYDSVQSLTELWEMSKEGNGRDFMELNHFVDNEIFSIKIGGEVEEVCQIDDGICIHCNTEDCNGTGIVNRPRTIRDAIGGEKG